MIERFAMKNRSAFFLTFWTSATQAEPIDGWGLFLDVGQLKPVNDASGREYQDSKVIGDQIDYQFALGDSFSFSLFASENMNKGTLPVNTKYGYYKAGILGAEFRVWMGSLFIGVHGGQYFLTWIESLSSYTGLKWSGGSGWGLGLEGKSGWSLGWYKEKSEKIDFDDFPDQRIEGDRFILGYRWR
jgi:hypothetical protein